MRFFGSIAKTLLLQAAQRRSQGPRKNHSIERRTTMNELERLLPAFTAEIAKIYASNAHSGVIPAGRRTNVLVEVARVRARYCGKLASLRAAGRMTDAIEHQLARIENEHAATLTNAV
jgi:hypothetical protein